MNWGEIVLVDADGYHGGTGNLKSCIGYLPVEPAIHGRTDNKQAVSEFAKNIRVHSITSFLLCIFAHLLNKNEDIDTLVLKPQLIMSIIPYYGGLLVKK